MSTAEERMQNEIDELEQENRLLRARNDRLEAKAAPVQERTDYAVHLNHCNIGECEGVCKYLDDDCPALKHADMKAKWDRSTPPAAKQWTGLSDDAKLDLISDAKGIGGRVRSDAQLFILLDMQEAKLKEKNL